KLGLGSLAGERDGAKLVKLGADFIKLCAHGGDLGGMFGGKLVQFVAHTGKDGMHPLRGVEDSSAVARRDHGCVSHGAVKCRSLGSWLSRASATISKRSGSAALSRARRSSHAWLSAFSRCSRAIMSRRCSRVMSARFCPSFSRIAWTWNRGHAIATSPWLVERETESGPTFERARPPALPAADGLSRFAFAASFRVCSPNIE